MEFPIGPEHATARRDEIVVVAIESQMAQPPPVTPPSERQNMKCGRMTMSSL